MRPQYEESDEDGYGSSSDSAPEETSSKPSKSFGEIVSKASKKRKATEETFDEDSDTDSGPEEEVTERKRRHKHAPAESSSKKPVSVIRDIPGLEKKSKSLYRDVRFDPLYGKADLQKTRENYAFLNEYRESELKQMKETLKRTKNNQDKERLYKDIQSMQSRMETFKKRDWQHKVLTERKKELRKNKTGPYYLKKSEERKVLLEEEFKQSKPKEIAKKMERKRKKNTAKERKNMPEMRIT